MERRSRQKHIYTHVNYRYEVFALYFPPLLVLKLNFQVFACFIFATEKVCRSDFFGKGPVWLCLSSGSKAYPAPSAVFWLMANKPWEYQLFWLKLPRGVFLQRSIFEFVLKATVWKWLQESFLCFFASPFAHMHAHTHTHTHTHTHMIRTNQGPAHKELWLCMMLFTEQLNRPWTAWF